MPAQRNNPRPQYPNNPTARSSVKNVHPLLPKLTINRQFINGFVSAGAPCFALGLVEERKQPCGLLALHLDVAIPDEVTGRGFNFGHSVFDGAAFEVAHFAFEFYGLRAGSTSQPVRDRSGKSRG
jgi:hypothetical protein